MKKTTLIITGMSCAHCVNKIETALQSLQGVENAKVNLKKGTVKVKFDETIQTLGTLAVAVQEVGYEVESTK